MTFDPQHHHRRSTRLSGYDYSQAGAYFVTVCAQHRACMLGKIGHDRVDLTDCGRVVATCWQWLGERYPQVDLDEWIVMPNHLHGIITIADDIGRGGSRTAPTVITPKPLGRLIGAFKTLSTKHISLMHGIRGVALWQRNCRGSCTADTSRMLWCAPKEPRPEKFRYQRPSAHTETPNYEHIIRNTDELNHVRRYIADNPLQWAVDRENPTLAPAASLRPTGVADKDDITRIFGGAMP